MPNNRNRLSGERRIERMWRPIRVQARLRLAAAQQFIRERGSVRSRNFTSNGQPDATGGHSVAGPSPEGYPSGRMASNGEPPDLSTLIDRAERGDGRSAELLFAALYAELHRLSRRELARHGGFVTIGATTLLHEAYLDIAGRQSASFPDRARFMAYAARVMRGLIIDYARSRQAQKRGGLFEITSLGPSAEHVIDDREIARIGDAVDELAKVDRELADVVDLKFFCGFSFAEIAAMHGVSERTIERRWEKARIYLHHSIGSA